MQTKTKVANKSSVKTSKAIRKAFVELLSEKKQIRKISVTELVERVGINRGTFYSHYDDIYSVADEFENELFDKFFDKEKVDEFKDLLDYMDKFFAFCEENAEYYRLICRSDDVFLLAKRVVDNLEEVFVRECEENPKIADKENLKVEIDVFLNGVVTEYVKYCRGLSAAKPEEISRYVKSWYRNFLFLRSSDYAEKRKSIRQ